MAKEMKDTNEQRSQSNDDVSKVNGLSSQGSLKVQTTTLLDASSNQMEHDITEGDGEDIGKTL